LSEAEIGERESVDEGRGLDECSHSDVGLVGALEVQQLKFAEPEVEVFGEPLLLDCVHRRGQATEDGGE
jgi:hypothetical protein